MRRLEIELPDEEFHALCARAEEAGLPVTAYVHRVIDDDCRARRVDAAVSAKLSAIREAAAYAFPTGDIGGMLREIDSGR